MASSLSPLIESDESKTPLRKAKSSIRNDIKVHSFSPDIVEAAEAKYQKYFSAETYRSTHRKYIIYFCVYSVMTEKNLSFEPYSLGAKMGLEKAMVNGAITFGSKIAGPVKRYISPADMIPIFGDRLDLSIQTVEEITELCKSLCSKHPEFREMSPQSIAAGVIGYYCQIRGLKFDSLAVLLQGGLTEATINAIIRKIANADNEVQGN